MRTDRGRRRVVLATIRLAGRPIVVFNEPTEHLPDDLAVALLADMVGAAAGRTSIIITHRPELLRPVDATYRLVDGRIEGTWACTASTSFPA